MNYDLHQILSRGMVIPAHPLALNAQRKLDERRQRALTRYYLAAGVGGVAVGVHTTQFAIRDPKIGLLQPVLELAIEEVKKQKSGTKEGARAGGGEGAIDSSLITHHSSLLAVAGICGPTKQAVTEATLARDLGYDIGLVSLAALKDEPIEGLVQHCRAVADVIPIMGFYLQPAVGGRVLPFEFWRRLAEIENLVAIKIAPFNRYQTLEVVRAVAESGRADHIALYTGNDDNIIVDLLTPFKFSCNGRDITQRIVGGLLGHWAVWTKRAVDQHHAVTRGGSTSIPEWLTLNAQVTDANAAFFDAANRFHGCIAGLHEVLRRQGLLEGRWCLDPNEDLSPGQMEAIDRVYAAYPHLNDDEFVRAHLDEWLR
jgi:dihydrodipicolinate synthase/N-acetylneuraminate lyase